MMFTDDNIGYLKGRLEGTIIRDKCGTALLVRKITRNDNNGELSLTVYPIHLTGKQPALYIPFKEVVLKSPILGNVNQRDGCIFIARRPLRHDWRQGLRVSNTNARKRGSYIGGDRYTERDIAKAIYGKFATLEESLEKAKRTRYTVGFSRKFSVDEAGRVWYKEMKVVASIIKNKPELKKDFFWLKEVLDVETN